MLDQLVILVILHELLEHRRSESTGWTEIIIGEESASRCSIFKRPAAVRSSAQTCCGRSLLGSVGMLAPPPVIRHGAVRKLRRSFAITRIQVQDQRSCRLSQACIQVYKGGVSPSKSDLVRAVTELDVAAHLRPAVYDIVFLEYRIVCYEFLQDHRQEVRCYPVGFFLIAIPPQSRHRNHLHRGPPER